MKVAKREQKRKEEAFKEGGILKKISSILQMGYIPSRGRESYQYTYLVDENGNERTEDLSKNVNCFGHAFFNLTNEFYVRYNIGKKDTEPFWHFGEKWGKTLVEEVLDYAKKTGLEVNECSLTDKTDFNQWKVAFYIKYGKNTDYHFFLQEADGSWSSKNGETPRLEIIHGELPKEWKGYSLQGVYCVTNPHAQETRSAYGSGGKV